MFQCWLSKWRNGLSAKERRKPLEAEKGKEMDQPPLTSSPPPTTRTARRNAALPIHLTVR